MATLTISFTAASPTPDSYRVGYRKRGTADAYTYVTESGSPVVITGLDSEQDYEGTVESVCGEDYSSPETWFTDEFTSEWLVGDVWYSCEGETCDGEAIYCNWCEVRRVSDDALMFRYDHDDSSSYKQGHFVSLVNGVSYELSANWICHTAKTDFSATFLTANATSDSWGEPNVPSVSRSIFFTGVSGVNSINVASSSEGPKCSCVDSDALEVRVSNSLMTHCSGSTITVYVTGGTIGVFDGVYIYTDEDLSVPLIGYDYISDSSGTVYTINSSTGQAGFPTGDTC